MPCSALARLPIRSPVFNAYGRTQSLRRECLIHFVPVGMGHLDHLVSEYLEHDHLERPHQGLGNRVVEGAAWARRWGRCRCAGYGWAGS